MSIVIRWEHQVEPGKRGEYLALQRERKALAEAAAGCQYYVVAENMGEPFRYRVLVGWESAASARAEAATPERIASLNALFKVARNAPDAMPTRYEVVHRVEGQHPTVTPAVAEEREWILRNSAVTTDFIASRRQLFELVAKEQSTFIGHTLLRHLGQPHRIRILNRHTDPEASVVWRGPNAKLSPEAAAFAATVPDHLYTDVPTYFERWEPVVLS